MFQPRQNLKVVFYGVYALGNLERLYPSALHKGGFPSSLSPEGRLMAESIVHPQRHGRIFP